MAHDKQYLIDAAKAAQDKLPDQTGFILFTFQFNGEGEKRMAYISNANRVDAINSIKEWLIKCGAAEDWMKHLP